MLEQLEEGDVVEPEEVGDVSEVIGRYRLTVVVLAAVTAISIIGVILFLALRR